MSSTPHYQSRLFKTVRSQLHQLRDNIQLHWREFKVAATWGAQLSLYPFYVLFQAGRWGGHVLKQTATQSARALSAALELEPTPKIDQPVQNVLAAFELHLVPTDEEAWSATALEALAIAPHLLASTLEAPQVSKWQLTLLPAASPKRTLREKFGTIWQQWFPDTFAAPSPSSGTSALPAPTLALQGVATSLIHRHLVLVAADNQTLDILSVDQQHQLHQRIVWELANFWRLHRQSQSSNNLPSWQTWKALPIAGRPQMSLPVRAMHHLMAWVQHPSMAQSLMLPGTQTPPVQQPLLISLQVPLKKTWTTLYQAFLVSLKQIQPSPTIATLPPQAPKAMPFNLRSMTENILERTRPVLSAQDRFSFVLVPTQETATPSPSLSTRIGRRLKGYRGAIVAGIGAIALLPFALAIPEPAQAAAAPALPMPVPSPIAVEWLMDTSKTRRRSREETDLLGQVSKPSQGKVRIPVQKSLTPLPSKTTFETAIADWANRFSKTTVSAGRPAIDIDSVFVGYDRHPLEQILLLLDRAMAWTEIQFAHWWPIIQTQLVEFWKRWWPVVRSQSIQIWQHWSPVIQKWLLYALEQGMHWTKVLGTQLWNWGWPIIKNQWQNLWSKPEV